MTLLTCQIISKSTTNWRSFPNLITDMNCQNKLKEMQKEFNKCFCHITIPIIMFTSPVTHKGHSDTKYSVAVAVVFWARSSGVAQ